MCLDDVILFVSTGWDCLPNSSASFVSRVLPLSGFPILGASVVDVARPALLGLCLIRHISGRQVLHSLATTCHDQDEGRLNHKVAVYRSRLTEGLQLFVQYFADQLTVGPSAVQCFTGGIFQLTEFQELVLSTSLCFAFSVTLTIPTVSKCGAQSSLNFTLRCLATGCCFGFVIR